MWPKQRLAFECRANQLLFGGASEGGKSHFGRVATSVWSACIPNLQTRIYRKYYNDVISNMMVGPTSYPEILRPWVKDKFVKITENEIQFDNGALIQLSGLLFKKDLEKHQGNEKHVVWFDESTQLLWAFIEGILGWLRMPVDMKAKLPEQIGDLYPWLSPQQCMDFLPKAIHTANPIGVSVGPHRRAFIEPRKPFEYGQAAEKEGGWLRCYIPSRIDDNPSADKRAQRARLSVFGDATAAALIGGIWDAPTGDFFKEWDDRLHVVPDWKPPQHLYKFRTFDWGSGDPFCVLWWAVADDDTVIGSRVIPPGALVCYREWYGAQEDDMSKGIHMRNEDIAKGIVARTPENTSGFTLTDSFPFADRGSSKAGVRYTMADDFLENGVPLTKGNTARVYGWKQFRSRLQGVKGVPLAYWCESCIACRTFIPALAHHETNREDAAEDGEATHATDACRLAFTARPLQINKPAEPDLERERVMTPAKILKQLARRKVNLGS